MTSKITRDVLESYLFCKYKGYLKLNTHQPCRNSYVQAVDVKILQADISKIAQENPLRQSPAYR